VRVLALASAGRAPRFAAIALIAFGNIAAWTLITPSFDSPDEMEHYAYAQHLAETGKPPSRDPGPPARSTEEVAALDGVRLVSHIETADGRPPWLAADVARWHAEERRLAPLRRDNGGGPTTAATHSPLYYSLLLPGYAAGSSGTVFARLWAMRLLSALLGALTAGVVLLAVRELLPDRPALAAAAGLLVAFQPMVGFISGAVNNDAGVNLVAALLVYLVVRALRRGLGTGLGAAIGATLVVLPLMKLTGFALYPAAAIGLAGVAWRARARGALRPAPWAAAAGAFVVAAAAWAALAPGLGRSLLPTPGGAVTPGSTAPGGVSAAAHPLDFLSYLWQVFLPRLPFMGDLHVQRWPAFDIYVQRGWGAFGWYAKLFPDWVYGVIAVAMLAAGALALRLLWRARRGAARALAPELLFLASVALFVVLAVEIAYFTNVKFRSVVAEQGRYAFPAITALAGIAVAGAAGAGRRWAVPVLTAMVVGVIGLSFASQLLTLTSFYT
jgi:4-amino-4-deoxy-L-arabinose transferase-like glycosyltransferase